MRDFWLDDSWEEKGFKIKKHMKIRRIEKHSSRTIMLFKNGKATLTGAKSIGEARATAEKVQEELGRLISFEV